MKIALLLHGRSGGKEARITKLNENSYLSIPHFKENLIQNYDVDVFFHSWKEDFDDTFIKEFKPKSYLVEKQKIFSKPTLKEEIKNIVSNLKKLLGFKTKYKHNHLHTIYSRWYSFMKSFEIMEKYIKDENHYDFIITTRFDLLLKKKIKFEDYDKEKFYITSEMVYVDKYGQVVGPKVSYMKKEFIVKPDYRVQMLDHNNHPFGGMADLFMMGNFHNMKKLSQLFNNMDALMKKGVQMGTHSILLAHSIEKNLEEISEVILMSRYNCGLIKWTDPDYNIT